MISIIKTKKNGITLIALVVTIIVLLILAGVTIATLTGENGVLTKSEDAKEETRGARVEEARNLWRINQETDNYIGSETAQTLEELISDLVEQKLLTEDEKDKILGNDKKGIEATGEVTIGSKTIAFREKIKVGDYVDYNPTVSDKNGTAVEARKLSYSSPIGTAKEHGNGNSVQNFTATVDTKWRILSIENGTIELISKDAIKTSDTNAYFTLEGARGYLYAEQELNEVCKIFGYGYGADTTKGGKYTTGGPIDVPTTGKIEGTGARSITIEDINKKAGIKEDDYKKLNSNYGDVTWPESNVYYPTVSEDATAGESTLPGVKKLKITVYTYDKSKIENPDVQDMLFNENYWIASRCINARSDYGYFLVHYATREGINANRLCYGRSSIFSGRGISFAVCPIVTLKSDIIDVNTNYITEKKWKLK